MKRRELLRRAARGAGLTAASCVPFGLVRLLAPPVSAAPRTHLHPPGALKDDAAFTEACIGCGLCVEVCPHPSLPIRIVERSEGTVVQHRI